jgi:hypothetical protein
MARPMAEACQRLSAAALRRGLEPGADTHRLTDGTALRLRWGEVAGCFGGAPGRELLLACPSCGRWRRALHRPPGEGWSCWGCRPVSTASHRRSGGRPGRGKPRTWRLDQLRAAQLRAADLLGLPAWPPPGLSICWSLEQLARIPPRPGAPRLGIERRLALLRRLSALETLRVAAVVPGVVAELEALGGERVELPQLQGMADRAAAVVAATGWAVRRGLR